MLPVRETFARHGLRCTPQREEIYLALASARTHPTADELFKMVRRRQPGISLGTIYNTLSAFTRRGLCRRLGSEAGVARYDAETGNHVHLVTDDGRTRDVPEDLGRKLLESLPMELLEQVEQRMGARIDHVRVEFVGRPASTGSC
ncbi:MAG: Fur family transcriptional regulator [Phycisphaerales bacterium]